MADTVLARLAALKTAPIGDLKQQWRDLFDREPPVFNRRYLESRLAYRIQELAHGGLDPKVVERLEALGEQLSRERRSGKRRGSLRTDGLTTFLGELRDARDEREAA